MMRVETSFPVAMGALALVVGFGACADTSMVGAGGLGDGSGGSTEDVVYVTSSKDTSTGASSETVNPNGGSSVDKGAGGGGGAAPVCGDTNCDPNEACNVCIADCGVCPAMCGDGQCNGIERCDTCQSDCGACPATCGDGTCDIATETCMNCEGDCGACATVCGDGVCSMPTETCESCVGDCGNCPCVADAFEPNGTSPTASDISLGTDYCMLSVCSGDVDWLEFDVSGATTVTITFAHALGDLDLEIYSRATADYVDGSYGGVDDESVTLNGVPAGRYWARVYGFQGATNYAYCIRVD